MNKTNLKLLADWLIKNNVSLVLAEAFCMESFRADLVGGADAVEFKSTTACGTVGCALGWAPASEIPELAPIDSDYIGNSHYPSPPRILGFFKYCDRVFGLNINTCRGEYDWDWCFSGEWSGVDNTPKGAGIRILYLLDGLVTDNWFEDYEAAVPKYTEWYGIR